MEKYNQFKALYDEIDILISNHVTSSNTEFIKWHKKVERFLKLYYNEGDEYNDFVKTSFTLSLWTFSTIKQVLHVLMRDGLKVDYGQKIGKTIIFAKNHDHAEKILEVFNKQYPELSKNGQPFAKVIDNYMTYAQSAIDEFSDADKMPQIAISVDMEWNWLILQERDLADIKVIFSKR